MSPSFLGITAVLTLLGLNIPWLSQYLVMFASLLLLYRWLIDPKVAPRFATPLGLLSFFAASYYLFTLLHEIYGLNEGIRNGLTIVGCYALGYGIDSRNTPVWPRGLLVPLMFPVLGFALFSFLSVHWLLSSLDLVQIAERTAPSIWDGSEINAPGHGANASLGMCLLPAALLVGTLEVKRGWRLLFASACLILFAAGVYVNVALQNRTPFLATAAALGAAGALYLGRERGNLPRALRNLALLLSGALAVLYPLASSVDPAQFNILVRFSEERLSSLRYQAWETMLGSLHHSLLGGRVVPLGEGISYAHNLWLDVVWDAGAVPLLFLVLFHLAHLSSFRTLLCSRLPLALVCSFTGLGISFLVNFMQEPTLAASVSYFAASCFFLGLVRRFAGELEEGKNRPYAGGMS